MNITNCASLPVLCYPPRRPFKAHKARQQGAPKGARFEPGAGKKSNIKKVRVKLRAVDRNPTFVAITHY